MPIDIARQIQNIINPESDICPRTEEWTMPVNGAYLLDGLLRIFHKYVVCTTDVAVAASLWCTHTWLIDSAEISPFAVITAPEPECGKTRFLSLLSEFCCRPYQVSNITQAALFRLIDESKPTLLIDETDTFLRGNKQLEGVLNASYNRGSARVPRATGATGTTDYCTWGAKALCGIGNLPDTIKGRGIIMTLRRKLPTEQVARITPESRDYFKVIASCLARWSADNAIAIKEAQPEPAEGINDRAQDNWRQLLAIADLAGGDWPEKARKAAKTLSADITISTCVGAELLCDMKDLFIHVKEEKVTTRQLIQILCLDPDKPWSKFYHGGPITARQISEILQPYQIAPKTIRLPDGLTLKGYCKNQFTDAFARYAIRKEDNDVIEA